MMVKLTNATLQSASEAETVQRYTLPSARDGQTAQRYLTVGARWSNRLTLPYPRRAMVKQTNATLPSARDGQTD